MLKEKLKIIFVTMLSLSVCIGFSTFKIIQSVTAMHYSHSKNCEKDHYLQLDCFDSCNGDQIHAHSNHQKNTPVEVVVVSIFDALIIQLLKIVPMQQTVIHLSVKVYNLFLTPLLKGVFRPPAFA